MHCFWQCTCTAHAAWAYIGIECEEVVIPSYAVVCQFLKFFSRCHDCWHRQMEGCHMTHTHTPSVTLQHCQHSSLQLYPSTLHPHYTPAPLNPHSTPAPLNPQSTQAPFTPLYSSTSHPHSTPAPLNPHSTQAPLTPLYPSTPHSTLPQHPSTLTLPQHPSTLTLPQHPSTLTLSKHPTPHSTEHPSPSRPSSSFWYVLRAASLISPARRWAVCSRTISLGMSLREVVSTHWTGRR